MPFLLGDIEKQNSLRLNFIVLTCNTAHYFFEELQAATDTPILHMPREAANEFARRYTAGKAVVLGIEGSTKTRIYEREIRNLGFETVILDTALREKINCLIYYEVKGSDYLSQGLCYEILEGAVECLNCEKIILSYTKSSLVHELAKDSRYPVIDAQSILADRIIEHTLAERNGALDMTSEK